MTELLSLHLCQDLFTVFKDTVFHGSLTDLLAKVKAGLPPAALEYLEKLRSTFHMGARPYKDYGRFKYLISQVNQAVLEKRTIEVGYHSLKSAEAVGRRIDPYRIWFFDGTIYLIGRCHLRGQVRTFVLDRIHMLHLTDETFTEPKDFRFEEFIRHGFKVMHDELHTVRIRISPGWSRWVGERIWHESQTIQKQFDGAIEIVFRVAGLEEIKQWALSLGPEAYVIEPEQLREVVVTALGQTLAQYGDFRGGLPGVTDGLPEAIAVATSQVMGREQP
jgi:predicted DNA-binding transcriptional regulator YafY